MEEHSSDPNATLRELVAALCSNENPNGQLYSRISRILGKISDPHPYVDGLLREHFSYPPAIRSMELLSLTLTLEHHFKTKIELKQEPSNISECNVHLGDT